MARLLDYDEVLEVVRRLMGRCGPGGGTVAGPVVLVGGSALAAHGVRPASEDVDVYAPHVDHQAVHELEAELRGQFGPTFRLDVTSTENLWGSILVRDIADSPPTPNGPPEGDLRVLAIEDLFVLKLAADRDKDRRDLPALAARSSAGALIARFNQLARWHGDRAALPGLADAFVGALGEAFGVPSEESLGQLELEPWILDLVRESR